MDSLLSLLRMLIAATVTPSSTWPAKLLRSSTSTLYTLIRLLVTAKRAPASDGEDLTFDIVCLSLGLLTHLLEASTTAADRLRETLIDPACLASRSCTRHCACPAARSALHILCDLYLERTSAKLEAEDENAVFLRSYLTMLLALLALSSEANRSLILADLAGHPAAERWLREAIEEGVKVQEEQGADADRHEARTVIAALSV
jgi:hypothetical protein